jgi:hypothetical protein
MKQGPAKQKDSQSHTVRHSEPKFCSSSMWTASSSRPPWYPSHFGFIMVMSIAVVCHKPARSALLPAAMRAHLFFGPQPFQQLKRVVGGMC